MKSIKIIVEKHPDGYIAYPLGIKGVVVGQGDSYEEALADVKSAIPSTSKALGNLCWKWILRYWRPLLPKLK